MPALPRDDEHDEHDERVDDLRGDHAAADRGEPELEALLSAAQAATSEIALITDAAQDITYMSPSFMAMTGYGPADLMGKNCRVLQGPGTDPETTAQIRNLLASEQVFAGQILNYRKDGSAFWSDLRIVPMRVGEESAITHFVSVQRDISNTVASMKQLEAQAIHDHVTGLPNRTAAERAVDDAVRRSPGRDATVAVGLIDLDDFRVVNNTLGHAAGDAVLQQWATRVLARLRDGDVLARMGGDEFLLILDDIDPLTSDDDLTGILTRIHEAVEKPFAVEGELVLLGMSMGIALVPDDGTDSRSILRSADEALYSAKERRTDGASWWVTAGYAHSLSAELAEKSTAAARSAARGPQEVEGTGPTMYVDALRGGNVVVLFQPIVDLAAGTVTLFEALARLELPGGRTASPDEFLPHLDADGLRLLFDDVLDQGLRLIAAWDRPGVRPNVAVNLPPEILQDVDLVSSVEEALRAHGIEPGGLGLELLESEVLALETQRTALRQFADTGVRLAMDDLGSGHSSLKRLSSFPFSAIKLDRGLFLHAYDKPLETLSIMATLLQMGRDLGMTVVVEGLEDQSLAEAATVLGAPLGQGYFFARPLPADACGPWVDAFRPTTDPSDIRTPLGALAYHWQFARLAAPHPRDLEDCPFTHFLHRFAENSTAGTGAAADLVLLPDGDADADAWHALQHAPQGVHPTSSRLLIDWLAQQIHLSSDQRQEPEARIVPS